MAAQDTRAVLGAEVAGDAGFTWLLDHLFTYSGSNEIPLRTMYTLNTYPTSSQPPSPTAAVGNASPSSKKHDLSGDAVTAAAAQLRANLLTHVSSQSSQPQALSPGLITGFVRRCFAPQLDQVDFPSALTALDYLKELENKRRNGILGTLKHLGIERSDLQDREKMARDYPNAYLWLESMENKEHKIDLLYTHIYLGLRRWILVNDMSLKPMRKQGCIAMLNTLYPPTLPGSQFVPPTRQLTPQLLADQRTYFFRYITAVEKHGPAVLKNVMSQHARPGEETGWPKVREDLDHYLHMANSIIEECLEATSQLISPRSATFTRTEINEEQKRKVDSSISNLRKEPRPQTAVNTNIKDVPNTEAESPPRTPDRNIRWKRSLKSMRSASKSSFSSTPRPSNRNGSASLSNDIPSFDPQGMRRRRDAWEAQNWKAFALASPTVL